MSIDILCEHRPSEMKLDIMGVFDWPIWKKGIGEWPWKYDRRETCYFLRGRVEVEVNGETQTFGRGDLVIFPVGLSCTWRILEPVEKHYLLE